MTIEQIEQHYPNAVDAVALHEVLPDVMDKARVSGQDPLVVQQTLIACARGAYKAVTTGVYITPKLIEQMGTNDFLKYLKAKLGAM